MAAPTTTRHVRFAGLPENVTLFSLRTVINGVWRSTLAVQPAELPARLSMYYDCLVGEELFLSIRDLNPREYNIRLDIDSWLRQTDACFHFTVQGDITRPPLSFSRPNSREIEVACGRAEGRVGILVGQLAQVVYRLNNMADPIREALCTSIDAINSGKAYWRNLAVRCLTQPGVAQNEHLSRLEGFIPRFSVGRIPRGPPTSVDCLQLHIWIDGRYYDGPRLCATDMPRLFSQYFQSLCAEELMVRLDPSFTPEFRLQIEDEPSWRHPTHACYSFRLDGLITRPPYPPIGRPRFSMYENSIRNAQDRLRVFLDEMMEMLRTNFQNMPDDLWSGLTDALVTITHDYDYANQSLDRLRQRDPNWDPEGYWAYGPEGTFRSLF